MAIGDGKIMPTFDVHCAICERPALGLGYGKTKKAAEQELKGYGWREHMSLGWVCCTPAPAVKEGSTDE